MEHTFDVLVVGGGPAGMMAAGGAAARGKRVCILEKNPSLGVKLLITGGGRCNLTNNLDTRSILKKYGAAEPFLFSAFSQFAVQDSIDFFERRGMPTKVEAENRVFPVSDSARSVFEVMQKYIEEGGVAVQYESVVQALLLDNDRVVGVRLANGEELRAVSVVVAAGGASHPETGSTGDSFELLRAVGHTVAAPNASLVPLGTSEAWVPLIAGVALPNVKLTVLLDGKKILANRGKILFTHEGVSGPTVLKLSRTVGELLPAGIVTLAIDVVPDTDIATLNTELVDLLRGESINRLVKNSLGTLVPASLVSTVLARAGIAPDTACHSVTRTERLALAQTLKSLSVRIDRLLGLDKAIVSSGGVTLAEMDMKTCVSKKFACLYVVGDALDIDRPSGGYSLQLCWTTGFVAGQAV